MKRKNKNKKKTKLIYKIVVTILIIVSILFVIGLMALNVLSMKWFMLVIGILLVIDFLLWLFIIKSKKKKTSSIIAILFTIIMSLATFYIFKTTGLLTGNFSNYKTYNYKVVVLNDSKYNNIDDLDNASMGYVDTDNEETDKSLEYINNKITPSYKSYEESNNMAKSLLNKDIESILIEDSYYNMIREDNTEFNSNTKVIYSFTIKIKIDDFSRDTDVTKKPFNIFVSGIDTYGTVDSVSRSDVNMVVTINPKTKQILLTSIPRDYYVQLHNISGYKDKLTHAGLYGVDMSVKTVEDLLDIEINYYVKVNFSSVIDIVNALGGVNVYSDYTFTSIDGYNYTKGYNKVNGEEALSFARERKAFAEGDRQRIKDQQALLQAMFTKCTSSSIIYKYNSLLNSLNGSFVTNMPTTRLTSLIKMQLNDMASWTITSNSLTGSDSSNYTYSYSSQKLYVMESDEESIKEAHDLITSVYDGEILENSYDEDTGNYHTVTHSISNYDNNSNSSTSKTEETTTTSKTETSSTTSKTDTSKPITSKVEDEEDKHEQEDNSNTSSVIKEDNSTSSTITSETVTDTEEEGH